MNDVLVYLKMKELNIKEIYMFDKHLQNLDVKVIFRNRKERATVEGFRE